MMMIGSLNILLSLSYSRLPKPGDGPKVQATRRDFYTGEGQVIENRGGRNRERM